MNVDLGKTRYSRGFVTAVRNLLVLEQQGNTSVEQLSAFQNSF
jgi:hypothetical protein